MNKSLPTKGELTPRPYARILSMIGDQLIKNEKIALMELIKNAYDADSEWVQIRFNNFEEKGNELIKTKDSSIEIEDEGEGMSFDILETAWMNPASPYKYLLKEKMKDKTKIKKRIIQGEKGIGRYATLKIGGTIEIITRSNKPPHEEISLKSNFFKYDKELLGLKDLDKNKNEESLFLDQMRYSYERREKPQEIIEKDITVEGKKKKRPPHGTILRISNIKENWTITKVQEIVDDIKKLNFSFVKTEEKDSFFCEVYVNNNIIVNSSDKKLSSLFSRAPIRVSQGRYTPEKENISFLLNGKEITLSIQRLKENRDFRKHYCDKKGNIIRKPECGPFDFEFYIFDLNASVDTRYYLENDDNKFVKDHRVYLYRDGVRVYPYGDRSDDWLGVDVLRGTGRAGDYLSNDQIVGYIGITRHNNPYLRDKTNREGLIEIGNSFEDFKYMILSILGYLKKEFNKYKIINEHKGFLRFEKESETEKQLNELIKYLIKKGDNKSLQLSKKVIKEYRYERGVLWDRLKLTEDLASVGLSVESTSHDTVLMMTRIQEEVIAAIKILKSDKNNTSNVLEIINSIRDGIDFIYTIITGIQPIFRSFKRSEHSIEIKKVIQNVRKYYGGLISTNKISFIIKQEGPLFKLDCHESILLQVFINLVDNAIYWLNTVDIPSKEILILINGRDKKVIFADNGPGIDEDDVNYIFEPFFTTKGVDGRGMGLYITKQLLGRKDYTIKYISGEKNKILSGANFILSFDKKGRGE